MLKGPELLAKIKELSKLSKAEVVRACGYSSTRKDGRQITNFTAFYQAHLEALGALTSNGGAAPAPRRGKTLSYKTTVHFNGNLMVGKAYCELLGWGNDTAVKIQLIPGGFKLTELKGGATVEESAEDVQPPADTTSQEPDAVIDLPIVDATPSSVEPDAELVAI